MNNPSRTKRVRYSFDAELAMAIKLRDTFRNDPFKRQASDLVDNIDMHRRHFEDSVEKFVLPAMESSALDLAEAHLLLHTHGRKGLEATLTMYGSDVSATGGSDQIRQHFLSRLGESGIRLAASKAHLRAGNLSDAATNYLLANEIRKMVVPGDLNSQQQEWWSSVDLGLRNLELQLCDLGQLADAGREEAAPIAKKKRA